MAGPSSPSRWASAKASARSAGLSCPAATPAESARIALVAQAIKVGGDGDLAQMFVSDGGIVSSNLFMNIDGDGSLEITGPTGGVDVTGDVNVGVNFSGSIQFINDGTMIIGGLLHVGAGGSIEGNGTLVAPNRQVDIGGHIDTGLSPGLLTFDADVALTATARMTVEMAGTAAGLFDVVGDHRRRGAGRHTAAGVHRWLAHRGMRSSSWTWAVC